jgi:hypothetical protein
MSWNAEQQRMLVAMGLQPRGEDLATQPLGA